MEAVLEQAPSTTSSVEESAAMPVTNETDNSGASIPGENDADEPVAQNEPANADELFKVAIA